MHNKWGIGLAASALLFAGGAFAQQSPARSTSHMKTTTRTELSQTDRTFLRKTAQDNLAETQCAKWIEQKTNDPAIRQYAKDLRTDHSNAEAQLKTVASEVGVTLPTKARPAQISQMDQLKKLSGKQLDDAFLKAQLRDHQKAIKAFDREIENTRDSTVKDYAAMVLPHLQDHIRIAEDLAGNMNLTGKAGLNEPTEAVSAQALTQGARNQNAKNQSPQKPY